MARRISRSQIQAQLRQAESKRRQAIQKYNNDVRARNARVNTAIKNYNREVRAHNARVRANRSRLRSALSRLSRQTVTVRYTTVHRSVLDLTRAYERVDTSNADPFLADLAERETANSAHVLNSLLEDKDDSPGTTVDFTNTTVTDFLVRISPDLNDRWGGALFGPHPGNPDAARHFCTSSREIIATILEIEAPNDEVLQHIPNCELTPQGTPPRRAKLQFMLHRQGKADDALEDFAETNIADVVNLFPMLNAGAHGPAGKYSMTQLSAIKNRVEGSIEFICEIARQ